MNRLTIIGFIVTVLSNVSLGQPTIITLPPDSVSPTSAYLRALCYPNGGETEVGFLLNKKGNHCEYEAQYQFIDSNVSSIVISVLVTGLMQNAAYQYSAYGGYANGYYWGLKNDVSFTTPVGPNAKGFAIPLYFQDSYGLYRPSLKFGVHTYATFCTDWQLDECELPPLPPSGLADYRFVDPPSIVNSCFGLGTNEDLRPYHDSTQVDTFKVHLQPYNGSYPVIVSWPNLNNYYKRSVRLLDLFGGIAVNIDMKAQTSDTISVHLNELLIIAEGPMNLISANFDYGISNGVIVNGSFNPGGLSTDGWFEWGLTNNYGNSTSEKYIGNGTILTKFRDSIMNLQADSVYHYRAVIQNANGVVYGIDQTFAALASPTGVIDLPTIPKIYRLYQNYPNPFNPSTVVQYDLPASSHVIMKLYNILGQEVRTLIDELQTPGVKSVKLDASDLSNGVYFYKLVAEGFTDVKKMVLLK